MSTSSDALQADSPRSQARVNRSTAMLILLLLTSCVTCGGEEPLQIGSRLELFVDDWVVASLSNGAGYFVHQPNPREVVLVTDEPWEGNTSAYYTIFQDGDLYRMYYRGSHADVETQKSLHPEVTCYAESGDGIHWTKPKLGLFEYEGSKSNNIVWDGIGTHNFTPFRDDNPDAAPAHRYKAIARGRPRGKKGLYAYSSPDGIHWRLLKDEPVITEGAFDSQNLAFWDPVSHLYVDYHRTFIQTGSQRARAIMTCTSRDFVNWTEPTLLKYQDQEHPHLYTNAIRPYPRAPHIRIGFPTRYLPETSQVEPIFMSSRDGITFRRSLKPVIPRTAPADRDGNRSNYMANGLVALAGNDDEYSVFGTEAYYVGPDTRLRRFTYRVDGFVSIRATGQGEVTTKPLSFSGNRLVINYAATSGGSVRAELQSADGNALPGFELSAAVAARGDATRHVVSWRTSSDVGQLRGQPVRIRFVLDRADLYSFQFPAS